MSTYGRNFEFRVPPRGPERGARYVLPADADADIPIGAPVRVADGATPDAMGLLPVGLATGAQAPVNGLSGIAVFEHAPAAFAGDDPYLTTFSDKGDVPRGRAVQVVAGSRIKVVLRNTADRTFYQMRNYAGRVMVAPANLTGLAVGDFLTPGTGDDDAGYWAAGTAANGWLVVEHVDTTRGEVECRMTF